MQNEGENGGSIDDAAAIEFGTVSLAKRGDRGAFEQLYRGHVGHIYALCLRMTGNTELAEELTQSSFVRIWEQLAKFQQKSSFRTWAHRVALNVVLEHLRSSARHPTNVELFDDQAINVDQIRSQNARMDLEWAIGMLPKRARHVFVLYEIESFQHDEIAQMLGIAVGTSKAQLFRARRLLKELLE